MEDHNSALIENWLSQLPGDDSGYVPEQPTAPSALLPVAGRKRKHTSSTSSHGSHGSHGENPPNEEKPVESAPPLTRRVLRFWTEHVGHGKMDPVKVPSVIPDDFKDSSTAKSSLQTPTSSELPYQRAERLKRKTDKVRSCLRRNGMEWDQHSELRKYPELEKKAEKILKSGRASPPMRAESVERVTKHLRRNSCSDVAVLYPPLTEMIIKRPLVPRANFGTEERESGDRTTCAKDDKEELGDVRCIANVELLSAFLPGRSDDIEESRIAGLVPSYTFGIASSGCTHPKTPLTEHAMAMRGVAPGVLDPFFIIQQIGADYNHFYGCNLIIPAGATIVNARRALYQYRDTLKSRVEPQKRNETDEMKTGPDLSTFVYSCLWDAFQALILVHWYEDTIDLWGNQSGAFDVNYIGHYALYGGNNVGEFRRDLRNILDWGATEHKQACADLVAEIAELEEKVKKMGG